MKCCVAFSFKYEIKKCIDVRRVRERKKEPNKALTELFDVNEYRRTNMAIR